MIKESRNEMVDVLKGVAMLLVVLGHTMTNCTVRAQSGFLFRIIWTLQMPLFILISGYVTRYSKVVCSSNELLAILKKRTIAYLLPLIVWSVLVRGLIFGQSRFLNIPYMLWHMDSGYWFLFSLWTMVVVFFVAQWGAEVTGKKLSALRRWLLQSVYYVICMSILTIIGLSQGFSFLCIKLTLYYMPFYYVGHTYGKLQDSIARWKNGKVVTYTVTVATITWVALLAHFDFFSMPDEGVNIIFRALASLLGCIAVCGLLAQISKEESTVFTRWGQYIGVHSLEIYLVHYLFLNLLPVEIKPLAVSLLGALIITVNYIATLLLTILVVWIVNKNKGLQLLLWGKYKVEL